MLVEDVLDFDSLNSEGSDTVRRHRNLREARAYHLNSHATPRSMNHRGQRTLRRTHPAHDLVLPAPRAHHLRYNHFTRPPRCRNLQEASSSTELLDGLSIRGGYDGNQIFFRLDLDVSKGAIEDLRDIILKPLQLLSQTEFLQDLNLFSNGGSVIDSVFDNIDADISFSAGAHLGVTGKNYHCTVYFTRRFCHLHNSALCFIMIAVGFELQGNEFIQLPTMTQAEIASRAFIQFDDISAKFTTTARASGDMDIASIGTIGIENATIAFAFGLGIVEASDKIYFNDISSVIAALRDNPDWQRVGVMDISIPMIADIDFADGLDLSLNPIVSISSPDLFVPDYPSMSIDLNLE